MISVKPNPNWLPLTLVFGDPGPFTAEVTQFSLTLIGYYCIIYVIKGDQMFDGFPCIQCYGRQHYHTIFDQAASGQEGCCFALSHAFSVAIQYIQPLQNWTEIDTFKNVVKNVCTNLASLGIHEYFPRSYCFECDSGLLRQQMSLQLVLSLFTQTSTTKIPIYSTISNVGIGYIL